MFLLFNCKHARPKQNQIFKTGNDISQSWSKINTSQRVFLERSLYSEHRLNQFIFCKSGSILSPKKSFLSTTSEEFNHINSQHNNLGIYQIRPLTFDRAYQLYTSDVYTGKHTHACTYTKLFALTFLLSYSSFLGFPFELRQTSVICTHIQTTNISAFSDRFSKRSKSSSTAHSFNLLPCF